MRLLDHTVILFLVFCCCSPAKSSLTLCNPMNCSMPGFPGLHYLLEFAQIHVHWVSDAIQPSHPLLPSSPFAFSLFQHQGLFQWVGSLHQEAKVLELQLQHHSFQWIFFRKMWGHTRIHKYCCCYCCLVAKSCLTLWDPMNCSMPGFPGLHHLLKFAQIHVHWVSDAIQPSRPLLSPSSPAFYLSQHQGLFQWVDSSYRVAKVLVLQHQSFQWIFRVDFL